jgi:hypothetical protein
MYMTELKAGQRIIQPVAMKNPGFPTPWKLILLFSIHTGFNLLFYFRGKYYIFYSARKLSTGLDMAAFMDW